MTKFRDLKYRLCFGFLAGAIALVLVYFAHIMFVQFAIALVLSVIIFIGMAEWMALVEKKKIKSQTRLVLLFSALFMMGTYLEVLGYNMSVFRLLLVLVFGLVLAISQFKGVHQAIFALSSHVLGVVFVLLPLSLMLYIIYPQSIGFFEDGRIWVTYLLVVTKFTDIGGYFFGKIWGKRKLAPHLSPKKTIEGSLGGLALSILSSVGFHFLGLLLGWNFSLTLASSIGMGFLLGIVAQFGDLTESLFKRDALIKDSNNIPGLGGVLDTFDSLIFTTPTLYLFMRIGAS